jgi:hypothetical protein
MLARMESERSIPPVAARSLAWAPSGTLALFGAAIFTGSALVFLVEPMVAKMLLPLFGGTPAVWAVSLVFFQAVLLGGYLFAHVSIRLLSVRRQAFVQLAVLFAPVALLPIAVRSHGAPPESSQAVWLLGVLAVAAGVPFFIVSTASPVLQRWFSATGDRAASDPYFLYAASNAGSLLGLLAYPALLEPRLTLTEQSRLWSFGYVLFAILTALCARSLLLAPAVPMVRSASASASAAPAIAWRRRLRWVGMAALPSSLMLGTTSYVTTDIGSVPLLWVLPLAAYLVSFIVAFSRRQLLSLTAVSRAVVVSSALVVASVLHVVQLPIWALVGVHTVNLFLLAVLVHRRLALERPPAEQLTEFYLLLSVGGVCGGIFNALVAPFVFPTILEYPIALVLALSLRPGPRGFKAGARFFRRTSDLIPPLGLGIAVVAALGGLEGAGLASPFVVQLVLAAGVACMCCFARRPARFAAGFGVLVLIFALASRGLHTERTFFGVLRVEGDATEHRFVHGTTIHGIESFTAGRRDVPLTYYTRGGPIGQTFDRLGGRLHDVAAIGLGAGSIASYGRPGQTFTFYEIDRAVARIASDLRYFTFLHDSKARIRIVIGDGRLEIARAPDRSYDLIVLDAFSSDAVPVHLLTREAVELYVRKLRPGGVLAFHITNNYLDLSPVVAGDARALGLVGYVQTHHPPSGAIERGASRSTWVVAARDRATLAPLVSNGRWRPLAEQDSRVWTDQFSNILSVAKWLK